MLENVAYALLGLVMVGCLLYVTMSPEVEDPRSPKRPLPSNNRPNPARDCARLPPHRLCALPRILRSPRENDERYKREGENGRRHGHDELETHDR